MKEMLEKAGPRSQLLILDRDAAAARQLSVALSPHFKTDWAPNGSLALERANGLSPDVVLLALEPGAEADDLRLLDRLRDGGEGPGVIVLGRDGDVNRVVRAMKAGAFHYVTTPVDLAELITLIHHCRTDLDYRRRIRALQYDVDRLCGEFVAADPRTLQVLREIERAAPTEVNVLITGECGTGKEMVARRIHALSARQDGPFVGLNCGAFPPELIEAELFGHEKGAFTGADRPRRGKFELAAGGTLFLDEIGDGPELFQIKLLRILEERSYYRVGGESPRPTDVRVLAATSKNLERGIERGSFRKELYYRLNVFRIHLMPLAERPGDILPLARHFLKAASHQLGKHLEEFSPEAGEALLDYHWPGNIRELRNVVERVAITAAAPVVGLPDLARSAPAHVSEPSYEAGRTRALRDFKRRYCSTQLAHAEGNLSLAAERSGLKRQSFQRMCQECGIDPEEFRP
jgi:DNA-binding NtrC family response regulator